MTHSLEIKPTCQADMKKSCKRNPELEKALKRKIDHILEHPDHYKPLRYDLAGERRVHILKSFVLKFEVTESNKTVTLLTFGHHDEAYQR